VARPPRLQLGGHSRPARPAAGLRQQLD
jgi:hypothetical protein